MPRDAKVRELRLAENAEQDVSRLYVAVQHAVGVRRGEGAAQLHADRRDEFSVNATVFSADEFRQAPAGEVLHRQVRHPRGRDSCVVDDDDVRMPRQPPERLALALEANAAPLVGQVAEQLDGHLSPD